MKMKRFIAVGATILASLIIVGMVFALAGNDNRGGRGNRNDPTKSWTANACFAGGSLAGTCDTLEEWIAGWFLIRYEYGLISLEDFPRRYRWILPTNTPAPSTATYTASPTLFPSATATNTLIAASATPSDTATNTAIAASATPSDTATNTEVPPSATPSNTATNTAIVPSATATNTATNTDIPPSLTPTNTATNTPTDTPTNTPTNTATP